MLFVIVFSTLIAAVVADVVISRHLQAINLEQNARWLKHYNRLVGKGRSSAG